MDQFKLCIIGFIILAGYLGSGCHTAKKKIQDEQAYIVLQPISGFDKNATDSVAQYLQQSYPYVTVNEPISSIPDSLFTAQKKLLVPKMLQYISGLQVKDSNDMVITLVNEDLTVSQGILSTGGVMGFGNNINKSGLVSGVLVNNSPEKYAILKHLCMHELGHIIGIEMHCPNRHCIMQKGESNPLALQNAYLCDTCKAIFISKGFSL